MLTKIITIAVILAVIILILKLLKASMRIVSLVIWLFVVSVLIYLALPWFDPYLQNLAKPVSEAEKCYGLILESGDCFGSVR